MSPEPDFEWPDLCPVGIMSSSKGGVDRGDDMKRDCPFDQAWFMKSSFPEWVVGGCVPVQGPVEAEVRCLSSNTRRAEAVARPECQSLMFYGGLMRGVREPHPSSESSTLEQKGQTESRAYSVH